MRVFRLFVSLVIAVGVTIVGGSAAHAADPLTGRVVDINGGVPVAGLAVTMYDLDTSSGTAEPGDVVGSATTGADGRFAIDVTAAPDAEEFFVHVDGAGYQGGWLNGYGLLAATPAGAVTVGTSGDVGDIRILSTNVSGRTVSAATGRPIGFVIVVVYAEDYSTLLGLGISDLRGRFSIDGINREEIALQFVGTLTGHEIGWLACDRSVVPTSGQSCTTSPGNQGDVLLDRL